MTPQKQASVERLKPVLNKLSKFEPPLVDLENPWPGLASFTEETRAFFHGREQEVTDLFRRVQRKLLTILFGQSGYGKSSLLRAGLVPKLRPEGYCPIYVRLDHTPGSMSLSEQIKEAVFRTTAETGTWTKPGASVAGESLWEFLHHRDDQLKDASGRTLVPLIIFDQFEEIFTLAQTDATGRARAEAFITDLADLVENRPPLSLEEKLEQDPSAADRFDFDRADYRLLISLREDYLPHLEGLKSRMPSITQNRLRLARMSGKQALESVLKTGGKLVSKEVAESIVLFISGAKDVAHAEVEPSLLSLVSRELNQTRQARGHATITSDLLEGSRDLILNEYYDRTLADTPRGVRAFIEDVLLTDSGFRESVAEERVKKAFAAAGAAPDALATLVNHRLLRIEERLDVRRVELTHDVLCGIVKTSRDTRLQRLALRKARRLRWMVAGLAAGLAVLVTSSLVVAARSRQAALEAAQRSSRSDFTYGSQFLEDGRTAQGMAYLARAAVSDPRNYAVGPRLISALTSRPFTVPLGQSYNDGESTQILGFSKDGTRAITVRINGDTTNSTLSFWDVATASRIVDPISLGGVAGRGNSAAFDRENERVAIGLSTGIVQVFETATGRSLLKPIEMGNAVTALAFSPDGRWLAAATGSATSRSPVVNVWDSHSGELRAKLDFSGWVSSVSFSPDGTRLLATSLDRLWHVWSLPDGQLLTPLAPGLQNRGANGQANFGQFSPDGRLVVITDMTGAELWDWAAQTRVGQRMQHATRSDYAEFSPDGSFLVTGSDNAGIWRVPSGRSIAKVEASSNRRLWLSRDGRRLLTVDTTDGSVHLTDTATGKALIEPLRTSIFNWAQFSPDEREIWTSDEAGMVRRWRASASAAQPLQIHFDEASGGAVQILDSGALLFRLNNRLETRDPATGSLIGPPQIHSSRYSSALRSSNGSFAVTVSSLGVQELHDHRRPGAIQRWTLARPEEAGPAQAGTFKFSDDETRLAQVFSSLSSNRRSRVYIWETATGKKLAEINPPDVQAQTTLGRFAFSRDVQRFAIGDVSGRAAVFDIASGNQIGPTQQNAFQILSVALSADGTKLASAGSFRTMRWTDVASGRDLLTPLELNGPISSSADALRISDDGRWVTVATSGARRIYSWDTKTGSHRELPISLSAAETVYDALHGRSGPEGGRFLVRNADVVRVFSSATGQLLAEPIRPFLTGGSPGLQSANFVPNGRFLVTRITGRTTFDIWALPEMVTNGPIPGWLPRLASAVAGGRINDAGEFQAAPTAPGEFDAIKAELAALPGDAPYVKWGRWFLEDPLTRTINPESPLTAEQARELADRDPLAALKALESPLRIATRQAWVEAEIAERDLLVKLRDTPAPDSAAIFEQLIFLAQSLNGQGRFAEAENSARDALSLQDRLTQVNVEYRIGARLELGVALAGQRKFDEAEPLLLSAWREYTDNGLTPVIVRRTATEVANLYRSMNRPDEATRWQARSTGPIDL